MQGAMPHLGTKHATRGALTAVTLVVAAAGTFAVAAPAKPDQVVGVALTADDARVPAGEVLVLRGRSFPRDAHIVLRAGRAGDETERIGRARTGRRGSFVAEVRIDAETPAGRYVAVACHDRCRIKASVQFRVQRP